jgi:hypothetical protein
MQANTTPCTRCHRELEIEDVFVLTHAGPTLSLKPLCEPCADNALRVYRRVLDLAPGNDQFVISVVEVAHAS